MVYSLAVNTETDASIIRFTSQLRSKAGDVFLK